MANKEVQLKIRTATDYDVLYPKTIISAVEGLSSVLASFSNNLVSGGALGTPSSGTLTNCTAATATTGDNDTSLATTAFVNKEIDYRNGSQIATDISSTQSFSVSHRNKFVRYTGASAGTLTIPLNTFNVGDEIHVLRYGAGEVTIARATGVSLYSEGSATENAGKKRINAQMQVVTMKCIAANVWVLFGALKT